MRMKRIFKRLARLHGVSVEEIKSSMQQAINGAWEDPLKDEKTAENQRRVACKEKTPTPQEVIEYVVGKMKS